MPAVAAEAPIYAAPAAWVTVNKAPLTDDGADARPWLLADRQVLIEGDKRSTFTDTAFRIRSAEMLRNWSDMSFEWQPDRDDLIVHGIQIIRDGKPIDLLAQGLKLNVLQRGGLGVQQLERNELRMAARPRRLYSPWHPDQPRRQADRPSCAGAEAERAAAREGFRAARDRRAADRHRADRGSARRRHGALFDHAGRTHRGDEGQWRGADRPARRAGADRRGVGAGAVADRKSTRLNSSH